MVDSKSLLPQEPRALWGDVGHLSASPEEACPPFAEGRRHPGLPCVAGPGAADRPLLYSASALNWATAAALVSHSTHGCWWTLHLSAGIFISLTETTVSSGHVLVALCIESWCYPRCVGPPGTEHPQHGSARLLLSASSGRHQLRVKLAPLGGCAGHSLRSGFSSGRCDRDTQPGWNDSPPTDEKDDGGQALFWVAGALFFKETLLKHVKNVHEQERTHSIKASCT